MTTSERSTSTPCRQQTLLPLVFPANPSAMPAGCVAPLTTAGSGRISRVCFAQYDLRGCCWRTCRPCANEVWPRWSGAWPRAGMTVSGTAYQLASSVRRISVIASGFWPTPVASDTGHHRNPYSQGGRALSYVLGGPVNPTWLEWLQGYPEQWTDVEPSVIQSSQPSQN